MKNLFAKRQFGKFTILAQLIRLDSDSVMEIMGKCIILKATYIQSTDCIEYLALSEMFEPLENDQPIPEYHIQLSTRVPSFGCRPCSDLLPSAKRD